MEMPTVAMLRSIAVFRVDAATGLATRVVIPLRGNVPVIVMVLPLRSRRKRACPLHFLCSTVSAGVDGVVFLDGIDRLTQLSAKFAAWSSAPYGSVRSSVIHPAGMPLL